MPGGRPTTYSLELADKICSRLATGESMRSVCRDKGMPAMSTFFKWIREHEEFSKQYALAKEESADALFDEILAIADEDVLEPLIVDGDVVNDKDGNPVMVRTTCGVNHARLRVDTRKWAASKLKPKKYGDKLQQELSGPDGKELPQSITISVVSPDTNTK